MVTTRSGLSTTPEDATAGEPPHGPAGGDESSQGQRDGLMREKVTRDPKLKCRHRETHLHLGRKPTSPNMT